MHYEAGLGVIGQGGCTTGFLLSNWLYGPFGSAAGHCADIGQPVQSPDGSYQGNVNVREFGPDVDAEAFSTNGLYNHAKVQQNSGHSGVMGAFSDTWPRAGEDACWSAAYGMAGDWCGQISWWNATISVGGVSVGHQYCVNIGGQLGVSGGPMYRQYGNGTVRAMAITSSIVAWVGTCGSHIQWVMYKLGMDLAIE